MSKFLAVRQVQGETILLNITHIVLVEPAQLSDDSSTCKIVLTTGLVEHVFGSVNDFLDVLEEV